MGIWLDSLKAGANGDAEGARRLLRQDLPLALLEPSPNTPGRTSAGVAEDIADEETEEAEEVDGTEESPMVEGTGSRVRLKDWRQRKRPQMGFEAPGGRSVPLIDCVHRLMHFWRAGDVAKVDEYLDARALRRNNLFHQLLQALIELAPHASEERSLLESISNHVAARGPRIEKKQMELVAE